MLNIEPSYSNYITYLLNSAVKHSIVGCAPQGHLSYYLAVYGLACLARGISMCPLALSFALLSWKSLIEPVIPLATSIAHLLFLQNIDKS